MAFWIGQLKENHCSICGGEVRREKLEDINEKNKENTQT